MVHLDQSICTKTSAPPEIPRRGTRYTEGPTRGYPNLPFFSKIQARQEKIRGETNPRANPPSICVFLYTHRVTSPSRRTAGTSLVKPLSYQQLAEVIFWNEEPSLVLLRGKIYLYLHNFIHHGCKRGHLTRNALLLLLLSSKISGSNDFSHHLQNGSWSNRVGGSQGREFRRKREGNFLSSCSGLGHCAEGDAAGLSVCSRSSSYLTGCAQTAPKLFIFKNKSPTLAETPTR